MLLAVGLLCGAALLVPTITQQRQDIEGPNIKVGDQMPPKYAIATAALGSFRGLAVDILWYRAERLKQQGKLFEANTLAEWITTLQPRFPQVWAFHAWNMAYNISVMTHTPEERWNWVRKGVNLLRDEGIVYNPTAVRLYRELAWIFFHKMGQFSDDMHWYYKAQLAQDWQELLGAPNEGATTADVLAEFRPIAEAADRYFAFDRPSRESRDVINKLIDNNLEFEKPLRKLLDMPPAQMMRKLPEIQDELREEDQYTLAEALTPILEAERVRVELATRQPLSLLAEDVPGTVQAVEQLRAIGADVNEKTLREIGLLSILQRYGNAQSLLDQGASFLNEHQRKLLRFMIDPKQAEAVNALIAFMRAKVLTQQYHMDPQYMYELMDSFGPIDWRHPASHAIYWASLGVEKSGELRDSTKIDVLNTDRNVIHGLQALMHYGRVSYDPFTQRIAILPDPRFIDSYDKAMDEARARAETTTWAGQSNRKDFAAGHENFLLKAILYSYIYGDVQQARKYYDKVRDLYGQEWHNQNDRRYEQTLDDLVMNQLQTDMGMQNVAQPFVEALLNRAFLEGLATSRFDVFSRYMQIAQKVHEDYNKKRSTPTPNAPRQRLTMLPFPQLIVDSYINFMQSPGIDIFRRARAYQNTPDPLKQVAFPRIRAAVYAQAQQMGLNPQQAFPAPPGLEQVPQQLPGQTEQDAPKTTERQ